MDTQPKPAAHGVRSSLSVPLRSKPAQRCTAGEAFALLRTASQHGNRKLRDIAADIVTLVSGQPPEPSPVDQQH